MSDYIKMDYNEKLVDVAIEGDRVRINDQLRQSPEADQGCSSLQVFIALLASLIGNRRDIVNEILGKCDVRGQKRDHYNSLNALIRGELTPKTSDFLAFVVAIGSIRMIEYLLGAIRSNLVLNTLYELGSQAAWAGKIQILNWLLSSHNELISEEYLELLFIAAAQSKQFIVARYLLDTYPNIYFRLGYQVLADYAEGDPDLLNLLEKIRY